MQTIYSGNVNSNLYDSNITVIASIFSISNEFIEIELER